MIFGFSILEDIYFDVHIIAIIHLKSSTLRPSSVSCVSLMKIQPATKMFNLMFSNRISTKITGASWFLVTYSMGIIRTFQMGYSNDMHIKIYVFEYAEHEYHV